MVLPIYDTVASNGGGSYVPPDYTPGPTETNSISTMAGAVTAWRSVNFAAKSDGVSDFGGVYSIISVDAKEIVLADPHTVNPAWTGLGSGETTYFSPSMSTDGTFWIGPFVLDATDCEEVVANFICPQGLYRFTDQGAPQAQYVTGLIEITPINADGTSRGAAITESITLQNFPEPI